MTTLPKTIPNGKGCNRVDFQDSDAEREMLTDAFLEAGTRGS